MELKNIVQIKSGKRMPKGTFLSNVKNSHPYIKVKDMQDFKTKLNDSFEYVTDDIFPKISKYIVNTGNVILSIVGTIGNVSLIDKTLNNASLTENCVKLIPNDTLLSEYLYYFLISPKGKAEIEKGIIGSTQPKLPFYNIEQINIPLIDKTAQQHIVNTIGTIDDKIENNEKLINKIEEFLLLNFIKLDKCEGLVFSDIFNCFNGGTFKSSDYVEKSEYKLITIKNIDGNGFNTDNATYIPKIDKYEKYKLKIGDILLTMTGAYLGRSGIVDEENCYLNQRVLKISGISKSFLYCFLKYNQNEIFNLGKGSAQPNLSLSDLNCFPVNYDINDINSFCDNDKYIDLIINLKIETRKLKSLKAQYLTKFFN